MKLLRRSLPPIVVLLASGCSVGTISRLDGEWPIRPSVEEPASDLYREAACGPDGSLVLKRRGEEEFLLVANGTDRGLEIGELTLEGAQIRGDAIYRCDENQLVRHRLKGSGSRSLSRPRTLATVEGLEQVCLLDGEDFAVLTSDAILVADDGRAPRQFWRGKPLAVAWDTQRQALWIASRSPLPVIDCIRRSDREVLFRIPLPVELESPSLRIVVSGSHVAVYAHDRYIESALLISPDAGAAASFGSLWKRDYRDVSGSDAGQPRLITPPAQEQGERVSLGSGEHFGRVAPYSGGFLVVDTRETDNGPSLTTISGFGSSDIAPTPRQLSPPDDWPRAVQGVGWDQDGVTLVAGADLYRISPEGFTPEAQRRSDALRRGTNLLINLPLAAGETVSGLVLNGIVSGLYAPLGALGLLCTLDFEWVKTLLAPVWYPIAKTFNVRLSN